MPATYAHIQFSHQVLPEIPECRVGDWLRLYEVGCHGPDPLFYCNPFWKNEIARLGAAFHQMSGREFFAPIARRLARDPDPREAGFAWGLLTHYCLDSHCHPYVNQADREGLCGHSELETEFDRMLMAAEGEERPHRRDLSRHLRLTPEDCALAARCLPGVTPQQLGASVKNMGLFLRILGSRTIISREMLEGVLPMLGDLRQHLMSRHRVDRLEPMTRELLNRYCQAQEAFPTLAGQFREAIQTGKELGPEFDPIFG